MTRLPMPRSPDPKAIAAHDHPGQSTAAPLACDVEDVGLRGDAIPASKGSKALWLIITSMAHHIHVKEVDITLRALTCTYIITISYK